MAPSDDVPFGVAELFTSIAEEMNAGPSMSWLYLTFAESGISEVAEFSVNIQCGHNLCAATLLRMAANHVQHAAEQDGFDGSWRVDMTTGCAFTAPHQPERIVPGADQD